MSSQREPREPKTESRPSTPPPTPPSTPSIPPHLIAILRRRLPPGSELLHIMEITNDLNDIVDIINETIGQIASEEVKNKLNQVKERVVKRLSLYSQAFPSRQT